MAENEIVARVGADNNAANLENSQARGLVSFSRLKILIDFGRFPGMIPLPYYASHNLGSG
jgi:hypothetical protein